ncbi:hypothetical protein PROFUN_13143, partial [Planoprotostelium fungivorum]
KPHSFLFIHNQSNTKGDLDSTKTIPLGQAGDGNAILLGNKHDVLVTSLPIQQEYLDYWTNTLKLTIPQIFVPKTFDTDLLQSVVNHKEDLIEFIQQKQKEGKVQKDVILSVFEADERDIELLETLKKAGLGDDLTSECNYDLLTLGNKDGFREFCHEHQVTQLPGGTFKDVEELEKFVIGQHEQRHTVVIKSPHGIGVDEHDDLMSKSCAGGGGQLRLKPPKKEEIEKVKEGSKTAKWQETVREWISKEKAVEAEQFADAPEREMVVDIYIDPTDEHHAAVVFDQLVKNENEEEGMAYYGAKYPSIAKEAEQTIMKQVEDTVAPALVKAGYRGPAGIDVLWNPLHFMELNMRTDAITYVKHLTDRLGKNLYQTQPGSTAFMSLVNLPLDLAPAQLFQQHADALSVTEEGVFALSNPNRQRWGFYDVVAVSPKGRAAAEEVMKKGLEKIWGKEKAEHFLKVVYVPGTAKE